MKKYYVSKGNDQSELNQWFTHCGKEQIPYIIVRKKTKYSDILWDYISYKPYIDSIFETSDYIPERSKLIFVDYANEKSSYNISRFIISFEKILIEDAYEMAEKLYGLIDRFVKENRKNV